MKAQEGITWLELLILAEVRGAYMDIPMHLRSIGTRADPVLSTAACLQRFKMIIRHII